MLVVNVAAANGRRFVVGTKPKLFPHDATLRPAQENDVLQLWTLHEPSLLRRLVTGQPEILTQYRIGRYASGLSASLYWGHESLRESKERNEDQRVMVIASTTAQLPLNALGTPKPTPARALSKP